MLSTLKSLISVVNYSKKLSDDDVKKMVVASQTFINSFVSVAWQRESAFVMFYADPATASLRAFPVAIFDSADQIEYITFNAENHNRHYRKVFVGAMLDAGVSTLKSQSNTISAEVGRQVLEAFIDRAENTWVDGSHTDAGSSYALTLTMPVFNDGYMITVGKNEVMMPNFVMPAYYDETSTAPKDLLEVLASPFSISKNGGAVVVRNGKGSETQLFNQVALPAWKIEAAKNSTSRVKPAKVLPPKKKTLWQKVIHWFKS